MATPHGSLATGGGQKRLQEETTTEQIRRRLTRASANELNISLPGLPYAEEPVLARKKEAFQQLFAHVR